MILRNKTNETMKRCDPGWILIAPGQTIEVTDEAGAYLLKAESSIWEQVKPKAPAKKREAE
jgi:hypothetical protein